MNLSAMAMSRGTISSGTSSGSSHGTHSYGSEGDMELQARMELKRKRRMESNRESAKRSRQRKQQHLDNLNSQVDQLRMQKQQLNTALNITTQNYAAAEAQNSVLRTQMKELESWLCELCEIIRYMNANQFPNAATVTNPLTLMSATTDYDAFGLSAWNSGMQMVQQPIDHLLYQ
ncbi:bZIP transcription factor 11-like isoform X1 [Phragmites australis]|uniref:bZIP transcription factor 11-like isoform X1 n=1 Tax=Phragmites australis TaxID=29695 RepID=UPI002D76CA3D|nr:bZIP transcription factor 11-like isoform X1 [Phragmites australis]